MKECFHQLSLFPKSFLKSFYLYDFNLVHGNYGKYILLENIVPLEDEILLESASSSSSFQFVGFAKQQLSDDAIM